MTPRLLSFAEIVEPAFTGWSLLYLWVGLSLLVALVACRAARALNRRPKTTAEQPAYPPPVPEPVNWLPLLPPVPAPSRHYTDALAEDPADWLGAQPADCCGDTEIRRRFDRLVAGL